MDFNEASEILSGAVRSELRDHAFGDREVFWTKDGEEIAAGYFGGGRGSVSLKSTNKTELWVTFVEDQAYELAKLGTLGEVELNDMTGPDTYADGVTMPGLTLEGVREELTGG